MSTQPNNNSGEPNTTNNMLNDVLKNLLSAMNSGGNDSDENAELDVNSTHRDAPDDDEEPMPMEERLRLKEEMEENCRSLTALLKHYQDEEQKLKEVVMEFIVRDVEEQNQAAAICNTVALAQQEKLSDPAYVRWAMEHKKGEFSEEEERLRAEARAREEGRTVDADDGEEDGEVPNNKRLSTDSRPKPPRSGEDSKKTQWFLAFPNSCNNVTEEDLVHKNEDDAGSKSSGVKPPTRGSHYNHLHDQEVVPAAINLNADVTTGDVVPFLASWRSVNAGIDEALTNLSKTLIARSLMFTKNEEEKFVLFVNGQPLLSEALEMVNDRVLVSTIAAAVGNYKKNISKTGQAPSPEAMYSMWWNLVVNRVGTPFASKEKDHDPVADVRASLTYNADQLASQIRDDGNDVMCAVPASIVAESALVRAFVIRGDLRAVELLGPNIDLIKCLFGGSEEGLLASVNVAVRDLRRVGQFQPTEDYMNTDTSAAITLLVRAGAPSVIVDVQVLSPMIPFNWAFSWGDICALAKTEKQEGGVVVKVSRQPVVQLDPVDALTKAWFPVLNSLHSMAEHVTTSTVELGAGCDKDEDEKTAEPKKEEVCSPEPVRPKAKHVDTSASSTSSVLSHPLVVGSVAAAAAVAATLFLTTRARQ